MPQSVTAPQLEMQPAAADSSASVRAVMRWSHKGYHTSKFRHEITGTLIRVHQHVTYGNNSDNHPFRDMTASHEIGRLPAGEYRVEWLQALDGFGEGLFATANLLVRPGGTCEPCANQPTSLPLETLSATIDDGVVGAFEMQFLVIAGPAASNAPASALTITRIWSNNLDYSLSHDCPIAPATLEAGRGCVLRVSAWETLRGDVPGRIYARYLDYEGSVRTVSIALSAKRQLATGTLFVPAPVTPDTAVEYLAPSLQHYFFTSSLSEQAFVDSGSAGAWQRTGVTFPVGGTTDVCRFYGDPIGGPNSHFYTASAAECDALKAMDVATPPGRPAWRYEGLALKVDTLVAPTGPRRYCDETMSRNPVYRLYNDGAARGVESNPRHVPSRGSFPAGKRGEDIVREMMAAGWIYEGNAFCN